ncbi:acetylornithine deacetylase [Thalassococcus lentus]|uniref:Acetylornithine deacetylase n=1 Tax=Thalassococcus lentus TaxID=1210524 RepID=A0ABT4XVI4_9RHOB|nr:acetylornithine deacetylase [Thalassococcus lentus]MDA7425969.1 acetylornithine deacetylase [Thalassococcus lentus]
MSRTLELLDRLIAFPTVSHTSNLDLIDWAHGLLRDAGFAVTPIPSADGSKAGLHARIGPEGPGGICLSGHTDVVPTDGQHWTRDPFTLTGTDTHVFGRGTTDMKGFLASTLALAERAGNQPLNAPLSLVLSYDEEVGCVGIQHMLPALAPLLGQPRLVVVGEPTSMQVATGHKGKAAFDVTCHGQAGHSALAPAFVNAIHVAADFVQRIRALQDRVACAAKDDAYSIPYSTLHVGQIRGGRALNIVPDQVTLAMEARHLAETPLQDIKTEIQAIADQVSIGYPDVPPLTVEQITAYPGLETDAAGDAVCLAQALAGSAKTTKVPFGTEAGFFAELGLDTVVVGPGDMSTDGHKPDEGLRKTELSACDAMMDRVLQALC